MELLLGVMALVVAGGVVAVLVRRLAQGWLGGVRSSDRQVSARAPDEMRAEASLELDRLSPGDVLLLVDGRTLVVESVLDCREDLHGRSTSWRWSFLSDGSMLEVAPDGNMLYDRAEVVHQGEEAYESLVGPDGALRQFEERVRAGVVGSKPVIFEHHGVIYRVASTGTFDARLLGDRLRGEVWLNISSKPDDNVYFEMEAPGGQQVLGIWTTHILLLYGRPLDESEVVSVYPGSAASGRV